MKGFKLLALLAITALGGCATQPPSSMPVSSTPKAPYKRTIQFVGDGSPLLEQELIHSAQKAGLIATDKGDFSEFRISFHVLAETPSSLRETPRFTSKLTRYTEPVSLNINYTVHDSGNAVITSGTVSRLVDVENSVYPRLQERIHIPENILSQISQEIVQETQTFIHTTAWSSTVIGMSAHNHVVIGVGQEAGLKLRDKFVTETHPVAQLEVAAFEKTVSGQSRAILRLLSGPLPTVGKRVIPVSMAHKK